MPGETREAALTEARVLGKDGIGTVLSLLGENVENHDEIDEVVKHYGELLHEIGEEESDTHISVKLTHLGLDVDPGLALSNLQSLATAAALGRTVVWVDIEASGYADATIDLFTAALVDHSNIGLCVQAYLYRTAEDVERLLDVGARLRLVKGAYRESPRVAYPKKRDVDANFLALACRLIERSNPAAPHGIATHDMGLLSRIREAAQRIDAPNGAFEVQMLYGIRRFQQVAMAREGVPVRVLISYGPAWYAWYMRRLAERPANLGFVVRSILSG